MSRFEGFEELVHVIDCGSFSAAAKALGVSKSHVSQQISRVEDRLGTRLLNRTTRKISLTETGALYYEQCRQVVEDLEAAESVITTLQQEVKGRLRISAPHLIGEALLVPAIAAFIKLNPDLEIELDHSSHHVDLVEERYDLAVQVGRRTDSSVVNRALAPTQFHVVASPDYLQSHPAPAKPADLKRHQCLLFTNYGQSKPWKFIGPNGVVSTTIKSRWRSNSGHALRGAAKQGLGIAYLPDYYLSDDLASGRLITVMEDWPSVRREIVAVYPHRRHLSIKIKRLTEFLVQYFGQEF